MLKYATGRIPDLGSCQDWHPHTDEVKAMLAKVNVPLSGAVLPLSVNQEEFVTPFQDQKSLGCCGGMAGKRSLEFSDLKTFGSYTQVSPLFIYKMARFKAGLQGDSGVNLRNIMGALAMYGAPSEESWPFTDDPNKFDLMPDWTVGAEADKYRAINYMRLDTKDKTPIEVLDRIKRFLASGFGIIGGFTCYSSLDDKHVDETGEIPFPGVKEKITGGHAIFFHGYDDTKTIQNPVSGPQCTTRGALNMANSWNGWGYDRKKSLGWLPYDYVLKGAAEDFWVILGTQWLDQGGFGFQ